MEVLIKHLSKFVVITKEEQAFISACFETIKLRKKENLVKEGSVCRCLYFVVESCLRMFFVNDKGIEQTTQFAIEGWWLRTTFRF